MQPFHPSLVLPIFFAPLVSLALFSCSLYAIYLGDACYCFASSLTFSEKVPLKLSIPMNTALNLLHNFDVVLAITALSLSKSGPATK